VLRFGLGSNRFETHYPGSAFDCWLNKETQISATFYGELFSVFFAIWDLQQNQKALEEVKHCKQKVAVNIKNLEGRFRKRFRLKNLENALR
jgi:hypothetical protein